MAEPTQADLDYLAAHPEAAEKFRARFGALPQSQSAQSAERPPPVTSARDRVEFDPAPNTQERAGPPPIVHGGPPVTSPRARANNGPVDTSTPAPRPPAPTQADIDYLKANPSLRGKFEARFGSAANFLTEKPQEQSQDFGTWAADQAGFLGRRFFNAAASFPGLPADAVNLAARYLPDVGPGLPFVGMPILAERERMRREGADSMTPLGGENIRAMLADYSGGGTVPRAPRNRAEEVGGTVADFAGSTAASGAGLLSLARGATASGTAGPLLRSIANNPGRFAASEAAAATGGALGSEAGREIAPDSAAAPIIGGLVGAIAPGTFARLPAAIEEGAKRVFRGGQQGQARVTQALSDFSTAGTSPTAAQASQSGLAQYVEAALRYAPGAVGRMRRTMEEQAQAISTRIRAMADNLSPNADEVSAGQAVERGITGPRGFVEGFRRASDRLYAQLDRSIPSATPVNPARTIQELNSVVAPIPNAPNVSGIVANTRLGQVARAITEDVTANGGSLPYESLKQLRSWIGRQLATSELISELPRAQLKQIYGALSDDMRNAAAAQGPGALRAFERANSHYHQGIERIDSHLSRLTKMGATPERIFEAIWKGREGETFLTQLRRSIPTAEWNTVAAAAMRRLGDARSGAQNAAGDVFSTDTFLTRWNELSPGAKHALFGGMGTTRSDLDAIARTAERIRTQASVLRNSSGTAGAGIATSTGLAAAGAALTGNAAVLSGIAGAVLLNNITARLMTNPAFVHWLAQGMRSPQRWHATHLGQLAAIAAQNPELRGDVENYLDGLSGQTGQQEPYQPPAQRHRN